jgi:hypothetical protein
MSWYITTGMPPAPMHRQQSRNTSKAFITASGVTRASAMFHLRCSLKISANSHRRLETRVSAIDSTPQSNLA